MEAPTAVDFGPRLCWYRTMSFPRAKKKPLWRQAEDYFRRERDRKLKPTLPRVRLLEAREPEFVVLDEASEVTEEMWASGR